MRTQHFRKEPAPAPALTFAKNASTLMYWGYVVGALEMTLPEPPSANTYWRHVGSRVLLSREAREYRKAVALRLSALPAPRTYAKGYSVVLHWYRGRKSGDLDNRIKQVLDALRGYAYTDDSEIVELHAFRSDDKANPRVTVTISEAV